MKKKFIKGLVPALAIVGTYTVVVGGALIANILTQKKEAEKNEETVGN